MLRIVLVVSNSLHPCNRLWPARLLCRGEGSSRKEYWSVLANTGCRTLLEHCSCCRPSRQPPWVPGAARTPATQAATPPPRLALAGANPSPPGQPQEQSPVGDPHAEMEIKPQLKPRGSMAKEDPTPPHQLHRLQSHTSMEHIKGHWELPQRKHTSSETWTLEAGNQRSRTRLESELPPQQVQRPTQGRRAA